MDKNKGFTLAEVLIAIVILGIISAITSPIIVAAYQKKVYITQLKREYSNLTNGFMKIISNDGVTKLSETSLWANIKDQKKFQKEFEKSFQVLKQYDLGKTRGPDAITYKCLNMEEENTSIKHWNTTILNNGAIIYYSFKETPTFPKYRPDSAKAGELGNIWIDVNGVKKPNIIGRDLFQFVLYDNGKLYGMASRNYWNWDQGRHYWKTSKNSQFNCSIKTSSCGIGCAGRIMEEGWDMKY